MSFMNISGDEELENNFLSTSIDKYSIDMSIADGKVLWKRVLCSLRVKSLRNILHLLLSIMLLTFYSSMLFVSFIPNKIMSILLLDMNICKMFHSTPPQKHVHVPLFSCCFTGSLL